MTAGAENSAESQRGRPFPRGVSGNPLGKPRGARHRITLLAEQIMQDDAEDVVRAVLTAAKAGDMVAARLILDRILPARRGRPIVFALPPVRTAADPARVADVATAVASGKLTPEEGQAVAAVLEVQRRGIELADHERRLEALEARTREDEQ
jgi:Family of unknown function (DUF5681)